MDASTESFQVFSRMGL